MYNDVSVIEACAVLSLEDLQKLDIPLRADPDPATLKRTYIEPGKGALLDVADSVGGNAPNSCHYTLHNRGDWLKIAIYQPAHANMERLETDIKEKYGREADRHGLEVYKEKTYEHKDEDWYGTISNRGQEGFVLRHKDATLWFQLRHLKEEKREAILEAIALGFHKLVEQPKASPVFNYSPSLVQNTQKACQLFTAGDTSLVFGEVIALAQESYGGHHGDFNYTVSRDEPKGHVYTAQECTRRDRSTLERPGGTVSLMVHHFKTVEGSRFYIGEMRVRHVAQLPDTAFQFGDETYVKQASVSHERDAVFIRKGNYVLTFTIGFSWNAPHFSSLNLTDKTYERLTPVIKNTLERIE